MTKSGQQLIRGLTWIDASAIVIGSIIGTGIFLKTATMAQLTGSVSGVLAAWLVAGLLSFTGALSYAELGSRYPEAGGEYVYLREAYGRLPSFLFGWMRFWIASPASIAAYAVGAATFLGGKVPIKEFACLSIILFSIVNCLTVALSGKIQTGLTFLKIIMILGLSFGAFFFADGKTHLHFNFLNTPLIQNSHINSLSAFGLTLIAALWAFDGWNNLPMVAGEVKNPSKSIPLSLGCGLFLVLAIYGLTNLAYFHALPFDKILSANSTNYPDALSVGTLTAMTFLGDRGIQILSIAMTISALGAMYSSILSGARVPYAMAKDGLFFRQLAKLSSHTQVPVTSILIQAIWSCVLVMLGTFDQLTDQVVFASWIFYAACTGALFVFRKRDLTLQNKSAGVFKTWGYPVIPTVFIIVSILLLANTVATALVPSLIGLGLISLGVPAFWFMVRKN